MIVMGKAVKVSDFTKDELLQVEERLDEMGYNIYDGVEHLYEPYNGDYYGVDSDEDTVFVQSLHSFHIDGEDGETPDVLSKDEYLDMIGLTLKTGESKMDLRGKCVRVSDFTMGELYKIQGKLSGLGVDICESISDDMVSCYEDGHYGVDSENDTMFYDDYSCYTGYEINQRDVVVMSREEFLDLIGLNLHQSEDKRGDPEPTTTLLHKLVANNGNTYYFDSEDALKDIMKADNTELARLKHAVIIVDSIGNQLRNTMTVVQMIETNFTIREI